MEDILIIDDSPAITNLLARTVLPEYGYTTRVAATGWDALVQIRQQRPDLILLDLELPDTTGLLMLQRITELDRTIPIVLMTAHGSERAAVDAFRLGARNYLIKPFQESEVVAALEQALREQRLEREKERLTQSLQQRTREGATLVAIGKSITALLDLDLLLERIVEAGAFLTRAEECMLLLVDQASKNLYLRAAKSSGDDHVQYFRVPIQDSLAGQVLQTRQALRLGRSHTDGGLKIKTGYMAQALLYVPLVVGAQAIGVLGVNNSRGERVFSAHDQWLLTSAADYAAIALENARLFQAVSQEQTRYRDLFNDANDVIFILDPQWRLTAINQAGQAVMGYSASEMLGWPLRSISDGAHWEKTAVVLSMLQPGERETCSFELALLDKEGKRRYTEVNARLMTTGERAHDIVCIARDVTERKYFEAQLQHLAFHDPLTNLPNRALLLERLQHLRMRAQRTHELTGVLFLDIDNFKVINDSLGHEIGDKVLCTVAQRLQRCVRPSDTVARLGGDEFIILLEDMRTPECAMDVAGRVQQALHDPVLINGHEIYTRASIGITTSAAADDPAVDLVREADLAMYQAKAQGKAHYVIFETSMNERVRERLRLETDLRHAVERNEFSVLYQPIVDLRTGRVCEVEALVRWEHPLRGQISPADFIPLAEETGLILPIGQFVLEQACRQVRHWHVASIHLRDLVLSVNLSPRQFQHPQLVAQLAALLQTIGLPPHTLKLEITEGMMMQDGEQTMSVMRALKELGVQLAIDDFGTGYCSLSYLKRFPVDTLKIDRSFISGLGYHQQDLAIVQAVIAFAKALNLSVTGEGVETTEQLNQLIALACTRGQGYYFSQPLPSDILEALIESEQADFTAAILQADAALHPVGALVPQ